MRLIKSIFVTDAMLIISQFPNIHPKNRNQIKFSYFCFDFLFLLQSGKYNYVSISVEDVSNLFIFRLSPVLDVSKVWSCCNALCSIESITN